MELRKSSRYQLRLSVRYRWTSTAGDEVSEKGETRDISAGGMFVFSDLCPPLDTQLSCEVKIPRSRSTGSLQIKGNGSVVRVHSGIAALGQGFAISGEMQIENENVSDWLRHSDQFRTDDRKLA